MGLAPCASFEGGAQRYAHAIELWLPLDVSDIKNLVSKTSRVREHEPLRIKSDSSDGRYKNSFFFFTLLGHWALGFGDSPSTGDPRKQACVFKYRLALAPGTLSRTSRCAARPPAQKPALQRAGSPRCWETPAFPQLFYRRAQPLRYISRRSSATVDSI